MTLRSSDLQLDNHIDMIFDQIFVLTCLNIVLLFSKNKNCNKTHLTNIARIANAVQVTICLLVSTSVY